MKPADSFPMTQESPGEAPRTYSAAMAHDPDTCFSSWVPELKKRSFEMDSYQSLFTPMPKNYCFPAMSLQCFIEEADITTAQLVRNIF